MAGEQTVSCYGRGADGSLLWQGSRRFPVMAGVEQMVSFMAGEKNGFLLWQGL